MPHIKVRITALSLEVAVILWKDERTSHIKDIRNVIDSMRPGVGSSKLVSCRKALSHARLQ